MEENKSITGTHKMTIHGRKDGFFTGVVDVISFDMDEILMETTQGMLTVKGKELHVKRLTLEKGEVELDGTVDSLTYSDASAYARKGESFIKRLFQ